MKTIDLRSDTVTRPTPEMRRAMAEAEVGDDVYGEDPTVNLLEQRAAEIMGKEAAVFVPTGTMANTIAVKVHTEHGQEVICDARAHLLNYELSMMAWFSGCIGRPIATEDGILRWPAVHAEIRNLSPHWAPTGLIEVENTHNIGGGRVYPQEVLNEICDGAHNEGIPVHMDGARVFNAAAYLGCPVGQVVERCDSVSFCLSKGLGAPVGSLLCGTAGQIERGRLYRKRLGGGMRQAGVLAAAGLIAMEQHPARLAADHDKARFFAQSLEGTPGIEVHPGKVQTNIVMFEVRGTGMSAVEFVKHLAGRGVKLNPFGDYRVRAVTHYDVTREQVGEAVGVIAEMCAQAVA
ncbi:MAG: threonine aldolase family protein [Bryobacteraceae bacterium]